MLSNLLPPAQSRADRKLGAMLIAIGIGIGIALDGLLFDNFGIGVFIGVLLGLCMYSIGIRRRLGR